jgi:hypothetical protein
LREIVTDGINGFLVRDGDFAGAISRVPDYDPFAVAATAQKYSATRIAEKMNRVWDRLLAGPSSDRDIENEAG